MSYTATIIVEIPGGYDFHDVLLPTDTASYNGLAALRGTGANSLFDQYAAQGTPRDLTSLAATALTPNNAGADALEAGRTWAMSPQMPKAAAAFNAGEMSIVADIAPLTAPITKAELLGAAVRGVDYPAQLFSHNDQQAWWNSGDVTGGSATGYLGRMNDLLIAKNALAAGHDDLDRISFGGSLMMTAAAGGPFRLSQRGTSELLNHFERRGPSAADLTLETQFLDFYAGANYPASRGLLEETLLGLRQASAAEGQKFADWIAEAIPAPNGAYVPTPLTTSSDFFNGIFAPLMNMIARNASTIPVSTGLDHQFFHIRGGVPKPDSHSNQAETAGLGQGQLDEFIAAVIADLKILTLENAVQVVLISEFGRTLVPNATGTDHAWATYAFVWGGPTLMGAQGGKIIGGTPVAPIFDPTNPDDPAVPWIYNSRGYIIPRNAPEQLFGGVGVHMGLTADEMANGIGPVPAALPRLGNFGATPADAVLPINALV